MTITKLSAEALSTRTFAPLDELPPYAAFLDDSVVGYLHLLGEFAEPGEIAAMKIAKGGFRYTDTPGVESGFIVEGTAVIQDERGEKVELTAGDGYALPAGWSGTFEATSPLVKVFYVLP